MKTGGSPPPAPKKKNTTPLKTEKQKKKKKHPPPPPPSLPMPPKKKSAPSSSVPPKSSSKPAKALKVPKVAQAKLTDFDIKAPTKSLELGNGVFPSKKVKLASWNVNGLRAVLGRDELKKYVGKYDPDVFCLNETKIDEGKTRP